MPPGLRDRPPRSCSIQPQSWSLPLARRASYPLASSTGPAGQPVQRLAPRPFHVTDRRQEAAVEGVEDVVGVAQGGLVFVSNPQLVPQVPRPVPERPEPAELEAGGRE